MNRRPQLSRQVPATSVSKFDNWCEREGHVNGGDKGRHAEQAINEYLPPTYRPERFRDDLDELEADLRADLNEVGHLSNGSSLNEMRTSKSSDETVKLTYRIAEGVQKALEQYVYDQEEKVRGVIGEYVAAALDEYRDGGQVARVRRYYEQLRENVEMISEDRVGSVVEKLQENTGNRDDCHIEEIRIAVEENLDVYSDEIKDDFVDRVIKRLGLEAVETSDGLYATPERAEELVQQHQVDYSINWHRMDKEGRVEYLVEAVKVRSRQAKGAGVNYNQVRDEIFEGHPSNDYCYELMELAGEYSGFTYGQHNEQLMLRYTGEQDTLVSNSSGEWVDEAVNLIHKFCEKVGEDPTEIRQPVIDNRIGRVKFPEEYTENRGLSDRAMEAVTADDRRRVQDQLTDAPALTEIETEKRLQRISEAEPVTDGGSPES